MDIREICENYSVSPQIGAEDFAEISRAGYTTVICNRPDNEIPGDLHGEKMRPLAEAEGLAFHFLPFTHQTLTAEIVARHAALVEGSPGPVLAYCASGTRCSVVWSFTQAKHRTADEIIAATTAAGYQLEGLRPQLEHLAKA